jgi:hypothetical protein
MLREAWAIPGGHWHTHSQSEIADGRGVPGHHVQTGLLYDHHDRASHEPARDLNVL